MANSSGSSKAPDWSAGTPSTEGVGAVRSGASIHPAWLEFVRFCEKLRHGDIERLKIQDGLPVLAELTTKKVKFG